MILFSPLNLLGLGNENDGDLDKEIFGFEIFCLFLEKIGKHFDKVCSTLLGKDVLTKYPPLPPAPLSFCDILTTAPFPSLSLSFKCSKITKMLVPTSLSVTTSLSCGNIS